MTHAKSCAVTIRVLALVINSSIPIKHRHKDSGHLSHQITVDYLSLCNSGCQLLRVETLLKKHTPYSGYNLQIQIHKTITIKNRPYVEYMSFQQINKPCFTSWLRSCSILWRSYTAHSSAQFTCSATVLHLEQSWAATKGHLRSHSAPWPLPRYTVTLAGLCTPEIFSLSHCFSSYHRSNGSFCGVFIRFSLSVCVLALMLLLILGNNNPNAFTDLFHCFLPDPSLKQSLPTMYAEILTIALLLLWYGLDPYSWQLFFYFLVLLF